MAKKEYNPFLLKGYLGPEYFCDREKETSRLISNALNGVNTTLISARRMGKTGLLRHVAAELKKQKIHCLYIDAYSCVDLKQFSDLLISSILQVFPPKSTLAAKVLDFLKALRPTISYDSISGQPQVNIDFKSNQEYEQSLSQLFLQLEQSEQPIVIMIDEFQQIANFPEQNVEAMLRSIIQGLNQSRFIFSGSHRHMLADMFGARERPFYMSTQFLQLGSIPEEAYSSFIRRQLSKAGKQISNEALQYVLDYSRRHTYYTQALCNRLYATSEQELDLPFVKLEANMLVQEQEAVFYQYRRLLSDAQWQLLIAMAKEDKVFKPTANSFLTAHKLGSSSTVQRSIQALETKEMIQWVSDETEAYWQVYDCFLSRWLAWKYQNMRP
ncbi:MAG: AAA family ATPase [Bacteroidia bacterium]